MSRNFILAVSTLVGVIVGAGIFGVPFAVAETGFFVGALYILGFGAVLTVVHLAYGEVILRTPGRHRLVGYGSIYLGSWVKPIIFLASLFSLEGALLAYIILGGNFLWILVGPLWGGSAYLWSVIFFITTGWVVFKGLRTVSWFEFVLDALFIAVMLVILVFLVPHADINALLTFPEGYARNIFLPVGVVLFALGGWVAIPELKEILSHSGRQFKRAILLGSFIPIVLTLIFVAGVVSVDGERTTPDTLTGLRAVVGEVPVYAGAAFGLLTIATSFFVLGLGAKQLFHYDFGMEPALAWLLAVGPPFVVFLLGVQNFMAVIGTVGVVSTFIEGSVILLSYQSARRLGARQPEYELRLPALVVYSIMAVFAAGVAAHFIFVV